MTQANEAALTAIGKAAEETRARHRPGRIRDRLGLPEGQGSRGRGHNQHGSASARKTE